MCVASGDEVDALTVVLVGQGRPSSLVVDPEPGGGQHSDELLTAVQGATHGGDAVAQELVHEDIALPQVRRDHQHTLAAKDSAELAQHRGELCPGDVLKRVVRDRHSTRAVPQRQLAQVRLGAAESRVAGAGDGEHRRGQVNAQQAPVARGEVTGRRGRTATGLEDPTAARGCGHRGVDHLPIEGQSGQVIAERIRVVHGRRVVRAAHCVRREGLHTQSLDASGSRAQQTSVGEGDPTLIDPRLVVRGIIV